MKMKRLEGLVAAPFTPFDSKGELALARIDAQLDALHASGVVGAFVCGTTGEGLSLTVEERKRVAARWQERARDRLAVIVHVGATCLHDARELAAHAEQIGAAAVGWMPPGFFRPSSIQNLVDCAAFVAAASPKLPFYYYHIPSMGGVAFVMHDFLAAAAGRIPNLAGIKFTHENLMDYSRCLEFDGGRFDILFGRDEMLLSALAIGARGAIGSTYNFNAPTYQRLIAAFQQGDLPTARRAQQQANETIACLIRHGGLVAMKAWMRCLDLDLGPVRLPLVDLTAEGRAKLFEEMQGLG